MPSVRAQSRYWNVASGSWGTAGNWTDSLGGATSTTFPANGTGDYYLNNGTALAPAAATMPGAVSSGRNIASLTIGTYNTLYLTGISSTGTAGTPRDNGNLVNAGLIQSGSSATDSIRMELNWTATDSPNVTNTGTITAAQGILQINFPNGNIINTGGLLLAKTGATFNIQGNATGSNAVQNGTLRSETGAVIEVGGGAVTTRFDGVTVDNQGTFQDVMTSTISASVRTSNTFLNGATVFNNAGTGTVLVKNTGGTLSSTTSTGHHARIDVGGTTAFSNAGTLRVANDANRTSSSSGVIVTQNSTFSINTTTATFSNTGTVEVFNDSTLTETASLFAAVRSITNEGTVHVRGPLTGSGTASFTLTGTGANGIYTQSGTGQRTLLERGGRLTAPTITINSGSLGGVGAVTGATTIGSGATLIAGDTDAGTVGAGILAFSGNLTLGDNSSMKFALGANTAGSGQITLAGSSGLTLGTGLTLTITDLTDDNWVSGTSYRLIDLTTGSITGSLDNFTLSLPSGWTGVLSSGTGGTDYLDLTLTTASIPEPSACALLLGLAAGGWVAVRRRRA